jgi:hypothetical protein
MELSFSLQEIADCDIDEAVDPILHRRLRLYVDKKVHEWVSRTWGWFD